MERTKDEVQHTPEEASTLIEIGRVSEETKGPDGKHTEAAGTMPLP